MFSDPIWCYKSNKTLKKNTKKTPKSVTFFNFFLSEIYRDFPLAVITENSEIR